MSLLLALASSGGGTLTTKTYTSNQTVVIPAGVSNLVLVSGQGAAGSPASSQYVQMYSKRTKYYDQRNDLGGQTTVTDGGQSFGYGPVPQAYCDPETYYMMNGVQNKKYTCYFFSDASYTQNTVATTGASATGFEKTFPGGAGGPASATSFNNVTVTPGGSYPIVVPTGGSITISYYA